MSSINLKPLDIKQLKIIESFINGDNIFMSGPAGTGKSYLIKIIKDLCNKHNKNCQVAALTGCAALLLECNAKTLHSWSGINANSFDINCNLNKIKKNKKIIIWKDIDVLIVDEISMMSDKLFELLDLLGKKIRGNDKPFGGIQIIFSGDFFQLPPINKDGDEKFCFTSNKWNETFSNIHILTKVFRQSDKEFSKLLNELRIGKIRKSSLKLLESRVIPFDKTDNVIPTIILPHKTSVENINNREHNLLPDTKSKIFESKIIHPKASDVSNYEIQRTCELYLKNNTSIEFKIGDQVICNRNISETIVNGSRGVIIDIKEHPIVRFINGQEIEMPYHDIPHEDIKGLVFRKIPLDYAWALTIHKCQGSTLDLCIMDIGSNIFECGQTYVALSRVKSLNGLYLKNFDYKKIKTNHSVKEFYNNITLNIIDKGDIIKEKKRLRLLINTFIETPPPRIEHKISVGDPTLQKLLQDYRLKKSKECQLPAYCILSNDVINLISENKPKCNTELKLIKGMGDKKIQQYGNDIINIINVK